MLRLRFSLASVPRGRFLAALSGWVVVLHAAHLVLLATTGTPAHLGPVVASTLVWAAVGTWGLLRGARLTPVEVSAALVCGAAAITADGVWGGSPGHAHLVSAGLLALVLGIAGFTTGLPALVGSAAVMGCQGVLLLAVLGTGPLGVYVAVSTVLTTAGACALVVGNRTDLQVMAGRSEAAAQRDPLTGLLNRRGASLGFAGVRAACPPGHRVAAVVLDLDHFKRVNDAHGHDAGDRVLVQVADVLRSVARPGDLVVRLGGEELAWVGAWPSACAAHAAAEELRLAVAAAPTPHGSPVTTSIGVALSTDATHASPDAEALSRLLVRADRALYEAKRTGRDRVVAAPVEGTALKTAAGMSISPS